MEHRIENFHNGVAQAEMPSQVSHIDAATYCEMAVSLRRLERYRESPSTYGLRDMDTGERFVIDANVLGRHGLSLTAE